jgi:hypothetical protein
VKNKENLTRLVNVSDENEIITVNENETLDGFLIWINFIA